MSCGVDIFIVIVPGKGTVMQIKETQSEDRYYTKNKS